MTTNPAGVRIVEPARANAQAAAAIAQRSAALDEEAARVCRHHALAAIAAMQDERRARVAASMREDFNKILALILADTTFLRDELAITDAGKDVTNLRRTAGRIAASTRRLSALAGQLAIGSALGVTSS